MSREQLRALTLRYVEIPGARFLRALGLTPNAVSIAGFAVSVAAAVLVGWGQLLAGGLVFLLGGALDLMDGALARYMGRVSRLGALLDSVLDRLGEAALYVGMAIYAVLLYSSDTVLVSFLVTLLVALVSSQMVSYLRARGEGLGIETRTGLMTRPERVIILSLGLMLAQVWLALGVIAVLSSFTVIQRFLHIWRQAGDG